jgi:membrane protein YdbS with pleckstrin-like domain
LLEPQSTSFFLLLIVVFAGLMWWLAVAKQLVFRVLAACLAFIPAMLFGVAAVDKKYYQNWNSAISDMTGQSGQTAEVPTTDAGAGVKFGS